MSKLTLTLGLALSLAAPLAASGYEDVGLGGRPTGMGGAFVALADDANALYWNPAGLVQLKRQEAMLMHGIYGSVSDVNFDYLAYVYPMQYSAVAVGWSTVGATLEQGDGVTYSTSRIAEDMYYLSMGLNPALFGNDSLTVGATLKRLTIDTSLDGGSGLGFDFGALFRPLPWAQFGIMLRNVATDIRNEDLPQTLRVGFASRLFDDRLRLALDFNTKDNIGSTDTTQFIPHVGAEFQPWKYFALRAGLDDGNLALGAGASYASIKVDYAFESSTLVGNVQRVSLSADFGPDGSTYVRPEGEKAAATLLPPTEIKGGYIEGRVMVFWEPSPSKGVAGYNVYLLNGKDDWVKVNDTLIWDDKRAAAVKGEKGETYHFAITAVGIDKVESAKSSVVEVLAR